MASYIPLYGGEGPGGSLTTGQDLKLAGVGFGAFGDFLQSNEQARGFKLSASEVLREGRLAALRIRQRGKQVQSAQKVGYAKAGVELSGTPLEVMTKTAVQAEQDALETMRQAERQAKELRRAAKRAKKSGIGGLVGAGIGGAIGGPEGAIIGRDLGAGIGANL